MKRFLIVLACAAVCVTAALFAGQDEKIDTIYLLNGKTIPAKVTSISAAHVNFIDIAKSARDRIDRKDVRKIIYHNGIAQEFNVPPVKPGGKVSWKGVRITGNRKETARLHARGTVEAVSPIGPGGVKAARRQAEVILKKKAAALQCSVVLVTGRAHKRRKGKTALYIIKGTVYGAESLQ